MATAVRSETSPEFAAAYRDIVLHGIENHVETDDGPEFVVSHILERLHDDRDHGPHAAGNGG